MSSSAVNCSAFGAQLHAFEMLHGSQRIVHREARERVLRWGRSSKSTADTLTNEFNFEMIRNTYVAFLLLWASVSSFRRGHRSLISSRSTVVKLSSSSGSGGGGEGKMPQPPPVEFMGEEFAREDIVAPPKKEAAMSLLEQRKREQPAVERREVIINPTGWIEDPNRPTGYGRPDLDDNEDEMRRKMLDDNWVPEDPSLQSPLEKWFKDTYIGSPYDSRKKQQARYVIKNITVICFSIGFIFTAVWFAFPNKFISVRGDRDFSQRYQSSFVEPEGLLSDEWGRSQAPAGGGGLFDDAEGLPIKPQYTDQRIPLEQGKGLRLSPPPTLDL